MEPRGTKHKIKPSSWTFEPVTLYVIQEPQDKNEGRWGGYTTRVSADSFSMGLYAETAGVQGTAIPVEEKQGFALYGETGLQGYFLLDALFPAQDIELLSAEDREELKERALSKLTVSEKRVLGL